MGTVLIKSKRDKLQKASNSRLSRGNNHWSLCVLSRKGYVALYVTDGKAHKGETSLKAGHMEMYA